MTGRVGVAAALTLGVLTLSAASVSAIAPRAGFWESRPINERGESASVLVRKARGQTLVEAISTPSPDCGQLFGIFGAPGHRLPRIRVDRRGRFARERRTTTDGISGVLGRFHGRRPRSATLGVRWRSGTCPTSARYLLHPVRRVGVRSGLWRGGHSAGGAFALAVVNAGRELHVALLRPSPFFRCLDGSGYQIADYIKIGELAWIRPDGSFQLREADDDRLATMRGSFSSAAANGVFRIIESFTSGRGVCDTGDIRFALAPP